MGLTLLHSEWPKLYGVLAVLSAIGLKVSAEQVAVGSIPTTGRNLNSANKV